MTHAPHRVVVAGGGVAGLEALLALHALAGDRVELTLVSPTPDFVYRPLAVAEPFALGHQRRTPLTHATRATGAAFVQAPLTAVDAAAKTVQLGDGQELAYDALVLATGASAEPAYTSGNVFTWDDTCEVDAVGGLLRDLEEGYSQRLAIVIPPGPGWPLPAYELALLIAERRARHGHGPRDHARHPRARAAGHLRPARHRGRDCRARPRRRQGRARRLRRDRCRAAARDRHAPLGPASGGRPHPRPAAPARPHPRRRSPPTPTASSRSTPTGASPASTGVWAAGDGIDFPVKFGGLAAEQADAAAADIAADAGAVVERTPFRPVLRGRLLTGSGPRYMRYDAAGGDGEGEATTHTLWWPPGKINGRYLTPWLAALDEETVADHLPQSGGLAVQADLHRDIIAS